MADTSQREYLKPRIFSPRPQVFLIGADTNESQRLRARLRFRATSVTKCTKRDSRTGISDRDRYGILGWPDCGSSARLLRRMPSCSLVPAPCLTGPPQCPAASGFRFRIQYPSCDARNTPDAELLPASITPGIAVGCGTARAAASWCAPVFSFTSRHVRQAARLPRIRIRIGAGPIAH